MSTSLLEKRGDCTFIVANQGIPLKGNNLKTALLLNKVTDVSTVCVVGIFRVKITCVSSALY